MVQEVFLLGKGFLRASIGNRLMNLDYLVAETLEKRSPRFSKASSDKMWMVYDKSLDALRARGYDRHLRPYEEFAVIIDVLENKNSKFREIGEDMLISEGEWSSSAILREKNLLRLYLEPENLIWRPNAPEYGKYTIKGNRLKHSGEREFKIRGLSTCVDDWLPLWMMPDEMAEFLYSRTFTEMQHLITQDVVKPGIAIPRESELRPLARVGKFHIDCTKSIYASRGMIVNK